MKTNEPIITEQDLNGVDYKNGSSSVNAKNGSTVNINTGDTLKGALAKNAAYGYKLNFREELIWIETKVEQCEEFQMEQIDYLNIPNGLTKYRIEYKLITNGIIVIYKFHDEYFALNCVVKEFDIYNEPKTVTVVEPRSNMNGKELTIGVNAIFVRNNINSKTTKSKIMRLVVAAERTLFQLEKNITAAAPKGLFNMKNGYFATDGDDESQGLEVIINGENTFYSFNQHNIDKMDPVKDNKDPIFIPIKLDDRTSELIQNYSFFKEEIKEIIGANTNILNGKKERLITGEIESQNDIPNFTTQHRINIRNTDFELGKKLWDDFNIIANEKEIENDEENINLQE